MRINIFALILIFTAAPFVTLAAGQETTPENQGSKQASQAKPSASQINNITRATVKAGAISCAGRVNQITNFLTSNSPDFGALLLMTPENPDKQLLSISMEIPRKVSSAYASASFAPNQADGCGGVYETVVYWPDSCDEAAAKNFKSFKKSGKLSRNVTVLDGGKLTKAFLLPAGNGCVSIKKEIVR